MSYRSIALAVAAFSSMHIANANAQSVYVAPGGVYIGAGPVYVTPAPNNGPENTNKWFNTSAFSTAKGSQGTAGRNSVRGPGTKTLDLSVFKTFSLARAGALELRVEGFNVFNRTQVTGLNTQIYKTTGTFAAPILCSTGCTTTSALTNFNTINAAGGTLFRERQVQVAVRFEF